MGVALCWIEHFVVLKVRSCVNDCFLSWLFCLSQVWYSSLDQLSFLCKLVRFAVEGLIERWLLVWSLMNYDICSELMLGTVQHPCFHLLYLSFFTHLQAIGYIFPYSAVPEFTFVTMNATKVHMHGRRTHISIHFYLCIFPIR